MRPAPGGAKLCEQVLEAGFEAARIEFGAHAAGRVIFRAGT